MKKIITGIIVAATMLSGTASFAQDADINIIAARQEITYDKVTMNGIFEELSDGQLWLKDGEKEFVINTDESTIFVDKNGSLIKAEDIKKGTNLMVVSSAAQTRSIPPQSYGYVIAEVTEDAMPIYAEINEITKDESGNTVLSGADGQYDIIVNANTPGIEDIDALKKGDQLLAYSKIVTMSIPAKVPAEKVVILKNNAKEIYVDGKKVDNVIYEDGIALLPVRKICEDLGYTVEWDDANKAITVGTVQMGVNFRIGENKYAKSKMAAFTLSKAPVVIDEKTYVPSDFFTEVLEANVTDKAE